MVAVAKRKIVAGFWWDAAKKVGAAVARAALEKGVTRVVFDRNGFDYHGRIAAVAQAAREAGLQF